jgi:sulfatase maturation enzyme AslB (radical SAM superfamily)
MSSGHLKDGCYLKILEEPYVYNAATDELYLIDDEAFNRILALHSDGAADPEAVTVLREAGLLQNKPRNLPVWTEGQSTDLSLRYLEVQITGRCDKACRHCYLGPSENEDMEPDTLEMILDQFSEMQGLKILVSGGEPACHPEFWTMMEKLPSYPLRAILITHGEWIGPAEASVLGERFQQVQISLDGLEAGHDVIRGKGSSMSRTWTN